eukprot:Skav214823  [mRNA]  locus=scaffold1772:37736:38017:+ [translate_table: standard]
MGASMDFLLRVLLRVERPAALPTHSILSLMNGIDPHRLSDILAEADGASPDEALSLVFSPQTDGDPAEGRVELVPYHPKEQFSQAISTNQPLM